MVGQAYTPYGLCPCIFSKVLDSLKILILQNEALQTAEAVQFIALKAVLRCASLQGQCPNNQIEICRSRPQAGEQDLPTKQWRLDSKIPPLGQHGAALPAVVEF
jgi:hypothetical protein